MEEEEAGEPELGDQRELFSEALAGARAMRVRRVTVALLEGAAADLRELDVCGRRAVGEVGIAVAELMREVEREPLGEIDRGVHSLGVVREAGGGLVRGEEDALPVPAALGLAALEGSPVLDGHEDVLEARAARVVGVDVACGDRADAEGLREGSESGIPARVAALVGPLKLDVEAVWAKRAGQVGGGVRVTDGEPVPRAAGEADEALSFLGEPGRVEPRIQPLVGVRLGEEAAEARIALRRLDEQRDVRAVGERRLCAGDRAEAERLRRIRELERPVDAVVVGERERLVTELHRPHGELLRLRGAVEERVGGVAVELDVTRCAFRHAQVTLPARCGTDTRAFPRYAGKRVVGEGCP